MGKVTGAGVDKKIIEGEKSLHLLNYMDVYNNTFINNKIPNHIVTANDKKNVSCNLQKGDLMFTPTSETRNDIAVSALITENLIRTVYSYHIVRLRFTQKIDDNFKAYMCQNENFRIQARRFASGSGQRFVISLPDFHKLKVNIPCDINEQKKIGSLLSNLDNLIQAQNDKITALQQHKKSLLQQMFI